MAPKGPKDIQNSTAIKVAAWSPRSERDDKAKKVIRPNGAAQLANGAGMLAGRVPQLPLAPQHGHPQTPGSSPVVGVGHLSAPRGPHHDKQQTLMSEVVAVAHHALDQLEGGNAEATQMAQAGHLDSPEKSGLWDRLRPGSEEKLA